MANDPIEHLVRVGTVSGPSTEEALRSFARLRSTPDEGRAVHRLLAREAVTPLPEPLLVAVASALVDRGEPVAAAMALSRARSLPALLMRANLLEGAGDLSAALALVEGILARDIDWPGARERHTRWREALGRGAEAFGAGGSGGGSRGEPETPSPVADLVADAPFRWIREAGRGGSATVYEAEDLELLRRVAVKVYHRPDRDRAKLLHEARVAVAVAGDGVVRIFDVDPGRGWLAMEWAPRGALRPQSGMGWARPLARALARVHGSGWVHHDVKPANVLLTAQGAPMLGDFGTARRVGEPSPPGSPGYVSPERLAGRASDPRDDVYGFGRVLAEALDPASGDAPAWRSLAAACSGPDAQRPRDGDELIRRIDHLPGSWDEPDPGTPGDVPSASDRDLPGPSNLGPSGRFDRK